MSLFRAGVEPVGPRDEAKGSASGMIFLCVLVSLCEAVSIASYFTPSHKDTKMVVMPGFRFAL